MYPFTLNNESEKVPEQFTYKPSDFIGHAVVGTATTDSYLDLIDYYWENHSVYSFSLLKKYKILQKYEQQYKHSSAEMYRDWVAGLPTVTASNMNDWLTTYLQIKDFLHE